MTKVILIHGAYGNPEENWFPWLKEEQQRKKKIQLKTCQFNTEQ